MQQSELAAYLGVSAAFIGHIEAGRKVLPNQLLLRLAPLATLLPAPGAPPALATAPLEAPPEAAPLEARRDFCQWRAANLRRRLGPLEAYAAQARRWQQVLPTLLATADERTRPWLLRRQEQASRELGPAAGAERHLLRLQAEALETEAAALAALLEKTVA
jgi:transcriptional regulator with XRE-family HTH domain